MRKKGRALQDTTSYNVTACWNVICLRYAYLCCTVVQSSEGHITLYFIIQLALVYMYSHWKIHPHFIWI